MCSLFLPHGLNRDSRLSVHAGWAKEGSYAEFSKPQIYDSGPAQQTITPVWIGIASEFNPEAER
jgi:hypothetical protein